MEVTTRKKADVPTMLLCRWCAPHIIDGVATICNIPMIIIVTTFQFPRKWLLSSIVLSAPCAIAQITRPRPTNVTMQPNAIRVLREAISKITHSLWV